MVIQVITDHLLTLKGIAISLDYNRTVISDSFFLFELQMGSSLSPTSTPSGGAVTRPLLLHQADKKLAILTFHLPMLKSSVTHAHRHQERLTLELSSRTDGAQLSSSLTPLLFWMGELHHNVLSPEFADGIHGTWRGYSPAVYHPPIHLAFPNCAAEFDRQLARFVNSFLVIV